MAESTRSLDILSQLLDKAKGAGADAADAVMFESAAISVAQRLGEPERLERAESCDLGLRVFVGQRQAVVSSTDFSPATLNEMVERAVAMARIAPEDRYVGIAPPDRIVTDPPSLDICDPGEPDAAVLVDMAREAEDAARAVPGITNSEGAEAGWSRSTVWLAASNGFAQSYSSSSHSVSASVLAGEGTAMERDYDYGTAVYLADLRSAAEIGRSAGERTVRRLGARKVPTQQVPIVYDPRVSNSLVRHFAGAINGVSVARGTSFLKDAIDKQIFSAGVTIIDDPHRPRGLRSKPFDAEGVANGRRALVEDGALRSWILDLGSARQLSLETTGNAARGTASPPSPAPTNLYMEAGAIPREDLIRSIDGGFYVTELIGMGVNGVTGDYSRGASGFWIENGEIAYPVSEMTIAGNLKQVFLNLTPANDLAFRYGVDAPTVRVDGMTVAGL